MNEPAQYSVGYESAARKELSKLDRQVARRIARAVSALGADPRPAGCRRLVGRQSVAYPNRRLPSRLHDQGHRVDRGRIANRTSQRGLPQKLIQANHPVRGSPCGAARTCLFVSNSKRFEASVRVRISVNREPCATVGLRRVLGWVEWYKNSRLYGYLGDLPPAEFEGRPNATQQRQKALSEIK